MRKNIVVYLKRPPKADAADRHGRVLKPLEAARQTPPNAGHDDGLVEAPPFEKILCRGRFHHLGR